MVIQPLVGNPENRYAKTLLLGWWTIPYHRGNQTGDEDPSTYDFQSQLGPLTNLRVGLSNSRLSWMETKDRIKRRTKKTQLSLKKKSFEKNFMWNFFEVGGKPHRSFWRENTHWWTQNHATFSPPQFSILRRGVPRPAFFLAACVFSVFRKPAGQWWKWLFAGFS